MKFFTPQLIQQGQSNDDEILNRHEAEWDQVCDRYEEYLETLRPAFPPGLAKMVDGYYLHDARVRELWQSGLNFLIVLRLDTPPHSVLVVQYQLLAAPQIVRDVLPGYQAMGGVEVEWLYDEVEQTPGMPGQWRHSILLSNGWELRLDFSDVRVQEGNPLLPQSKDVSTAAN